MLFIVFDTATGNCETAAFWMVKGNIDKNGLRMWWQVALILSILPFTRFQVGRFEITCLQIGEKERRRKDGIRISEDGARQDEGGRVPGLTGNA